MATGQADVVLKELQILQELETKQRKLLKDSITASEASIQTLVAQTAQNVLQLRNRIVVKTLETGRPKKTAKATAPDTKPDQQQGDGPLSQRAPEPPSGEDGHKPMDQGLAADADDEAQPGTSNMPEPAQKRKRGRPPAQSSAVSKRSKAPAPKEPQVTTIQGAATAAQDLAHSGEANQSVTDMGMADPSAEQDEVMDDLPQRRTRSCKDKQESQAIPLPVRGRQTRKQAQASAADPAPGQPSMAAVPLSEADGHERKASATAEGPGAGADRPPPSDQPLEDVVQEQQPIHAEDCSGDPDASSLEAQQPAAPPTKEDARAQQLPLPSYAGPTAAEPTKRINNAASAHTTTEVSGENERACSPSAAVAVPDHPSAPSEAKGDRKQQKPISTVADAGQTVATGPAAEVRVTRSRRGAPAADVQPLPMAAPPIVAPKPARGRGRKKRDIEEAQLGSPGLHPKSKLATDEPAKAVVLTADATTDHAVDDAALTEEATVSVPDCTPITAAAESDGAHINNRGEQQVPDSPLRTALAAPALSTPSAPSEQDLPPPQPVPAAAPGPTPPLAAEVQQPGPQEEWETAPPSVQATQQPIAPPAILLARVPPAIAATVAMLQGKPAAIAIRAALAPSASAREPSISPAVQQGKPQSTPAHGEALAGEAGTSRSPAGTASEARGVSMADGFCFGVNPQEQSSPDIPHFGQDGAAQTVSPTETAPPRAADGASTALECSLVEEAVSADRTPGTAVPPQEDSEREAHQSLGSAGEQLEADCDQGVPSEPSVSPASQLPSELVETADVEIDAHNARAEGRHRSLSLALAFAPPKGQDPVANLEPQLTTTAVGPATGSDAPLPETRPCDGAAEQAEPTMRGMDADAASRPAADDRSSLPGTERNDPVKLADQDAAGETQEAVFEAPAKRCDSAPPDGQDGDQQEGPQAPEGSTEQAEVAELQESAAQLAEDPQKPEGNATSSSDPAQPNKAKGGNLISCVRSFLPQRLAQSPLPAAGKKPVKVKALDAALAAKQKEAARAAERATRAAAVERQRQGQAEGAATTAAARGRPVAVGAQGSATVRATPSRPASRPELQGQDVGPSSVLKGSRPVPAAVTTGPAAARATPGRSAIRRDPDAADAAGRTLAVEEKRNDGPLAAAAALGSVKAKAAFFQLKEEQAKRAAADQGHGRRPGLTAVAAAVPSAPSYKAGATARVALAAGDGDAALAAAAKGLQAIHVPSGATEAPAPSVSRAAATVSSTVVTETVADKQKRVEQKRKEEEEKRRAELEARAKAKDDKLRNFEAAKQQQRMAGAGAASQRPPQPAGNPQAEKQAGKRQALHPANASAGTQGGALIKTEHQEHGRVGPMGPSSARTPGTKCVPSTISMVSPAVQMQIKLLPAVQPHSNVSAKAELAGVKAQALTTAGGGGPMSGLSKPQVPKPPQPAQGPRQPVAVPSNSQRSMPHAYATPKGNAAAGDLTEEDRRNVDAIKTSPYVGQVKPRTPGMPTTAKKQFTSYEISPYRSDSESDDDGTPRQRKPVPEWATSHRVTELLRAQRNLDADTIFGRCPTTIDIIAVFANMKPPGPTDARGRPRRDYRRRGSSGNWQADM